MKIITRTNIEPSSRTRRLSSSIRSWINHRCRSTAAAVYGGQSISKNYMTQSLNRSYFVQSKNDDTRRIGWTSVIFKYAIEKIEI